MQGTESERAMAELRESGWSGLRVAKFPAVLALAVLLFSDVVTDSWALLQGLWWVPRLLLALPALLWLIGLFLFARLLRRDKVESRRLLRWMALALLFVVVHLFRVWGFPAERRADSLRLVHWNACFISESEAVEAVNRILALDADVIILTDAGAPTLGVGVQRFGAAGYQIDSPGRFTVLSRLPVVEARPLIASRSRFVSRVQLLTPKGDLSIEAVDLPSMPSLPRAITVRSLVADLAQVRSSLPDVLVGDFNITRGSASLSALAPDAHEAFATAGTGWGGSFPRAWPLWPIDLTLVRSPWQAVRSQIVDFGFGRHRVQIVDLQHRP